VRKYLAGNPAGSQYVAAMSSTVTTATVAVMTTAVTLEGLMASLTLVVLVLLGALLLMKEIVNVGQGARIRRLTRGLDIAVAPMLIAFAAIIILNSVDYFSGH
jgi:hypothetical protein